MSKLYLLVSVLLVTSCQTTTTPNVKGTYRYLGDGKSNFMRATDKLEFTSTKFMMSTIAGEMATDYKVEDGYVFAGPAEGQVRFRIISDDTLRADENGLMGYDGTYVRVKE
ncbi:hypothetical protein GCM10028822_30190 [Hymenobacter terrigena]